MELHCARQGAAAVAAAARAIALIPLLLRGPTSVGAQSQCPPLQLKTSVADCRYVFGRAVSCESPVPVGTTAYFSCKPFHRMPTEEDQQTRASTCRENGQWLLPPLNCVPECGRVIGRGETLIIDGTPVQSSVDFPWHVAVYSKHHKLGSHTQICGGSLITTKFFVSAAHCFTQKSGKNTRPASEFAVGLGKINRLWNASEEYAQYRDVASIHIGDYGGQRLNHVKDFALVELEAEVELNAHTLPVCVDWDHSQPPLTEKDVGMVLGWGNLWHKEQALNLQSAALPFVPTEKCLKLVPAQLVQYVLLPDDRFCAGLINGSTVAHGDSGGGIAFQNDDRVWFLRGVVSVGIPELRTLTTFTNVSTFALWMANILQDEEILAKAAEKQLAVEIPEEYTATLLEEEQRLAYFREDLGLNLAHLHWHLSHNYYDPDLVKHTDRRGELFYYFHQQILSRYNVERLSNGLPHVKRFQNLRDPIREGYYPKLNDLVASRIWPGRAPYTSLADVDRDNIRIQIDEIERWRDRILEAIDVGYVVTTTGDRINLTASNGIDILGHVIESSVSSPNPKFYGEFVNTGHIALAMSHDPDNRYLESFGVMGDGGVAARDPVFYRWHATAAAMFQKHKRTLPSYAVHELDFEGVFITNFEVITPEHRHLNELLTFQRKVDLELSRGMDFLPRLAVVARITHLDHRPFFYRIHIDNRNINSVTANIRIFIAPKFDERGSLLMFEDQRHLMMELDRFTTTLTRGANVIERNSTQSSVSIPFERTFRDLNQDRPSEEGRELRDFLFCFCGWPHHLLLPRGARQGQGIHFQLFVMASDHDKEKVEQPSSQVPLQCSDSPSYCGLRGAGDVEGLPYPDSRPMGFPFDRRAASRIDTLRSFLRPNMFAQAVTIRHLNIVEMPRRNVTILPVIKRPAELIRPHETA